MQNERLDAFLWISVAPIMFLGTVLIPFSSNLIDFSWLWNFLGKFQKIITQINYLPDTSNNTDLKYFKSFMTALFVSFTSSNSPAWGKSSNLVILKVQSLDQMSWSHRESNLEMQIFGIISDLLNQKLDVNLISLF